MPRPSIFRRVKECPKYPKFKPIGIKNEQLEQLYLTVDEYEALRLADFEQMYQEEAAKAMGVSRQTFGNIVKSARKKVSEMIVMGKSLNIEGGDVTFLESTCPRCKKEKKNCPKRMDSENK